MTKTTNTKEAVLKELAKLYIRVEKSEDERAVAAVVSIVQCGLEALDGNRRCQQTGCERPARPGGSFAATAARPPRGAVVTASGRMQRIPSRLKNMKRSS